MSKKVVVRRSVNYGSDRKAASYLIEGENGWRFAKCSISEAPELNIDAARRILKNVKRNDPRKEDATYELVSL